MLVVDLASIGLEAIPQVGGKNAALGELIQALGPEGVQVAGGFSTTAAAYRLFLHSNGLHRPLAALLDHLDGSDLAALQRAGAAARALVLAAPLPPVLEDAIVTAYTRLGSGEGPARVAVRSSATAEDLPEASFAGQQDSFLHVCGAAAVLAACRRCYASLFNDRAISYRQRHGFRHLDVALAIGVQPMVRSDQACAGVIFTVDTESGCRRIVLVTAAYGLGETVVQGGVNPDEWLVFKPTLEQGYDAILSRRLGSKATRLVLREPRVPSGHRRCTAPAAHRAGEAAQAAEPAEAALVREAVPLAERQQLALTDQEVLTLARWACRIEAHASQRWGQPTPMDIEWAKDGPDGGLVILQARPETVQTHQDTAVLRRWHLDSHDAEELCRGQAVGSAVGQGVARVLASAAAIDRFQPGDVLVTERTDPDWEPILRQASGVVTDQGGRTCHAAIIAREMGITAVVGSGDGSRRIRDGTTVTLSCCQGDVGHVYRGALPFHVEDHHLRTLPPTRTRLLLNVGNPEEAFEQARIPCDGVGLARLEFIIASQIRVHPLALLQPERLPTDAERHRIAALCAGYAHPADYYVERLSEGMARIAAAFHPRPVLLRFSDFKSNEYARLLGGAVFEPQEDNPMLGWRGAARYCSPAFSQAFALECRALGRVRRELGLTNVIPMVPFCRTPKEAAQVLAAMAQAGLRRGEAGLQVYGMCELPSNVIALEAFAEHFDGFSIGSNDLTQLTLGVDRDSPLVAELFDESDGAVRSLIRLAIDSAHRCNRPIGLCGQAPSDDPDFTRFLVDAGIDTISLNPDAWLATRLQVAAREAERQDPPAHGAGPSGSPAG